MSFCTPPPHPEDMLLFWNGWSGYAETTHSLARKGPGRPWRGTAAPKAVLGWQQSLAESRSGGCPLRCPHWRRPLFPWPSAQRLPGVGGQEASRRLFICPARYPDPSPLDVGQCLLWASTGCSLKLCVGGGTLGPSQAGGWGEAVPGIPVSSAASRVGFQSLWPLLRIQKGGGVGDGAELGWGSPLPAPKPKWLLQAWLPPKQPGPLLGQRPF